MPSDAAGPAQRLSAIAGFRLVTADLPRLSRFYRDVLGCVAEGPEQAIDDAAMRQLGLHGTGRRQTLRLGRHAVSIDQYDPPGRPYPPDVDAASLAFQHLALVVDDIASAYRRVQAATAISVGGPQHLPASSGGVHAYKFRDPDGHPLELLQFPADAPAWQGGGDGAALIARGIDHSAISVGDADASTTFYRALGLIPGARTLNTGPAQDALDGLRDARVVVAPMRPEAPTPHLELLAYRVPRGAADAARRADDVAATRIVWRGARSDMLRDPDGHLHEVAGPARTGLP
ncbi:VOC family protein [Acidisphaera rubrifaciens]|uniref:Glyoxalase/bleomycin resistance protein/dioxygenase n=1 Tax=Acidisphaera rubrifaciens HS-AP3 TaxID=1231350 RepID=A0A0D6P462_9PROT|nr:VOC family protein [Acidisphaera rubrifaciens]GAN75993.1 glyoxalase/bleomycin resistance protein/dioxygenase [Acidisphaera rubrifaciens HS-AP3]